MLTWKIWLHPTVALAVALLLASSYGSKAEVPSSPPGTKLGALSGGAVFLDGYYLAPPYKVEVKDGRLLLNGRVADGSSAQTPSTTPEPTEMAQSALELAELAARRLAEQGVVKPQDITAPIRAELLSLLRSQTATAEVNDFTSYLEVRDKAGETAHLNLVWKPSPSADEFAADREELAKEWRIRLNEGGVLLTEGASWQQAPAGRSTDFLRALLRAFELPESQRLAALGSAVGSPPLAAALLRARLPVSTATPQPPPPTGRLVGGALFAPLHDIESHRDSQPPASRKIVIFKTLYDLYGELSPLIRAARSHSYDVQILSGGHLAGPGEATVDNLLPQATSRCSISLPTAISGP